MGLFANLSLKFVVIWVSYFVSSSVFGLGDIRCNLGVFHKKVRIVISNYKIEEVYREQSSSQHRLQLESSKVFADSEVSQKTKPGIIVEMFLFLGHCYIIKISLTLKTIRLTTRFHSFHHFLEMPLMWSFLCQSNLLISPSSLLLSLPLHLPSFFHSTISL